MLINTRGLLHLKDREANQYFGGPMDSISHTNSFAMEEKEMDFRFGSINHDKQVADSVIDEVFSKSEKGTLKDENVNKNRSIYELINETLNKDRFTLKVPEGKKAKFFWAIKFPLNMSQYLSIPNPVRDDNSNFYLLTLIISLFWIWLYTFMLTWWTFRLTVVFKLHYSVIPHIIFPLGIAVRDTKKFNDFRKALELFAEELADQEISLAEAYSAPIL